jgi:hypothetical protein
MSSITGESLFYEVSRVIQNNHAISYYQYRALSSFIELLAVHDRVALFIGEETDSSYLAQFDWLINLIHEQSDFKIDLISPKQRSDYITPDVMSRFETICLELYSYSLGLTSDDLFSKQQKDRTAEDMSEYIEQAFALQYPQLNAKACCESIYNLSLSNANSSELLYFFRAHLLQGIAQLRGLTPILENQRLIASVLQEELRVENKTGTLPYRILKMANALLAQKIRTFDKDSNYPRVSMLLSDVIGKVQTRGELLEKSFELRRELSPFREAYQKLENDMTDPNKSLSVRSKRLEELTASIKKVWIPTISVLGGNLNSSVISKIATKTFGKYGLGEVKAEHSEKSDKAEDSVSFSTSLLGLGTALAQTVSEVYKDSALAKPNRPLLDVLVRVVNLTDVKTRLLQILPVRDFDYTAFKLLDERLSANVNEVSHD